MNALVLALLLVGQPSDTLIVEVVLASSNERVVVEAVRDVDSTLLLPAEPVGRLLGVAFSTPWVTVAALQAAWPTLRVAWSPRELRVVILDDLRVLPASRRADQQVMARSRMALGLPMRSAPFMSLSLDEQAALLDAGYAWRGKVAVSGRVDNAGAAMWNATLAPTRHLFLSYADGFDIPASVSGRVAIGPLWLSAAYRAPDVPVDVAGLLRIGPAQLFASPDFGVLTITPDAHVSVQLAHTWETQRTAARISIGPAWASPFAFPVTSLHPRR
jgi:hypothetical protein